TPSHGTGQALRHEGGLRVVLRVPPCGGRDALHRPRGERPRLGSDHSAPPSRCAGRTNVNGVVPSAASAAFRIPAARTRAVSGETTMPRHVPFSYTFTLTIGVPFSGVR